MGGESFYVGDTHEESSLLKIVLFNIHYLVGRYFGNDKHGSGRGYWNADHGENVSATAFATSSPGQIGNANFEKQCHVLARGTGANSHRDFQRPKAEG